MLAKQALAWARRRTLDALSVDLQAKSRTVFEDREELSCRVEGRACSVVLWAAHAEVRLAFSTPVLPAGVTIHEASTWGPQKQEAWSSGVGLQTGDATFDDAFVVMLSEPNARVSADDARRIAPVLRRALLEQHDALRDATITPELLALPISASRRAGNEVRSKHDEAPSDRIRWALGAALLGFNRMPRARDLELGVSRAVIVARALEAAAPSA